MSVFVVPGCYCGVLLVVANAIGFREGRRPRECSARGDDGGKVP